MPRATQHGEIKRKRGGNPNWVKGVSGNPGGRPKGIWDVRALAQQHCKRAIEVLAEIMRNPKNAPSARQAAANALLERGYGRPVQPIEGPGPSGEHLHAVGMIAIDARTVAQCMTILEHGDDAA